ncbi:winged helix domain-containing protein [Brevundimonas diminuta]|uniref:winged helix domain-containing protein n=1 Tax=Brevundimonas diminuta TaxID=293 RepID=UPI000B35E113|nr:hypothetical protein [Brevundimonas diminuta]
MARNKMNPAAAATANGVRDAWQAAKRPQHTAVKDAKASITVHWDGVQRTFCGRKAKTLALLIEKGPRGFTSGEASPLGWARRTSHYIYTLRASGLAIETVGEKAGDARIGRYVLIQPVTVVGRCAV